MSDFKKFETLQVGFAFQQKSIENQLQKSPFYSGDNFLETKIMHRLLSVENSIKIIKSLIESADLEYKILLNDTNILKSKKEAMIKNAS